MSGDLTGRTFLVTGASSGLGRATALALAARGGTVLVGRGAGINEKERIFGMSIEPEKEIVLTVVGADRVESVLDTIVQAAELNEVGRGIAFVIPVDRVVGVAERRHLQPAALAVHLGGDLGRDVPGVEQALHEATDLLVLVVQRLGPEGRQGVRVGAVEDELGADGGGHGAHRRAET